MFSVDDAKRITQYDTRCRQHAQNHFKYLPQTTSNTYPKPLQITPARYTTDTFFKHYMLYKYVFATRQTLSFHSLHSYTLIPPIFPPLAEARSSQQVPLTTQPKQYHKPVLTHQQVADDMAAAEAAVQRAPELSEDAEALQQEGLSQVAAGVAFKRVCGYV